jgi:transcriptional regulator GlxA family with amidase domain
MRSLLLAPANREATREEEVSSILADIVSIVANLDLARSGRSLHSPAARRALNRAMEYIEAHLSGTIRVASLCRYAGTNIRTLERIFKRELGMTPQQYVKARRLNAVRRCLLAENEVQGRYVTEVALSHGFAHLGRFAGDYRRYFGEYPQETLQSR